MAYEVIFSPKLENARKPRLTPRRGKENKQQIEEKMKAAEKRRKVEIKVYVLAYVVIICSFTP